MLERDGIDWGYKEVVCNARKRNRVVKLKEKLK
jgi:hypothetical protein